MFRICRLFVLIAAWLFVGVALPQEHKAQMINGWGTVVDPDGNCKVKEDKGRLAIGVPKGWHDLTHTEAYSKVNAPRVLQKVSGDFRLTVKVDAFALPGDIKSAGGNFSFTSSGLLVWHNDKNFIRMERAGVGTSPFVWVELFKDGKSVSQKPNQIPDQAIYLRLERKGNKFTFAQKEHLDAKTWTEVHTEDVELPQDLQVGVIAVNTTTADFLAKLEGLELVARPAGSVDSFEGGPATTTAKDRDKSKADEAKKPALYDPKVDARAQIEAASAKAKRDHSRVLVMFGFEGCGWCHKLHGLFEQNPEIRKLLRDEYVKVLVDIEAPHANELLKECKAALAPDELKKGVGFPFLAVLDGGGKVVTAQRTEPLEEGKGHDPDRVKEFLGRWIAPRADARAIREAALAQAALDDKRVFLHFGAPWCGWCHRLEDFLARTEITDTLGPDFLEAKIDIDRMDNGKDVLATYRKEETGGIPWFVILDAKGKTLVTSDGPKGNIGYPAEPHEIEHFLAMLKQTARKMGPGQLYRIEAALRKARVDLGIDLGR